MPRPSAAIELEAVTEVDALLERALPPWPRPRRMLAVTEAMVDRARRPGRAVLPEAIRPYHPGRTDPGERQRANRNIPELITKAKNEKTFVRHRAAPSQGTWRRTPTRLHCRGFRDSRRIVHTAAARSLGDEELADAEQRQAAVEDAAPGKPPTKNNATPPSRRGEGEPQSATASAEGRRPTWVQVPGLIPT